MQINYVDLGVLLLLIIFGIRGGLRGFVVEVAGLVGLLAGLFVARAFYMQVSNLLVYYLPPEAAPVVAFILLVLAGMLVVGLLARLLQKVLEVAFASWLDRLLGIGAGLLKGAALCALLAYAALITVPQMPMVRDSISVPILMEQVVRLKDALKLNIPMPEPGAYQI